jgi:hypothetical protein
MGNRAVITTADNKEPETGEKLGIYLHWNGGRDSIEPFLRYCEFRGFKKPERDNYGWARLCQVIANFMGGENSIGIDQTKNLDCDNYDNGIYMIEDWKIVDRKFFTGSEQQEYDLLEMLLEIDKKQPEEDRLGEKKIGELLSV